MAQQQVWTKAGPDARGASNFVQADRQITVKDQIAEIGRSGRGPSTLGHGMSWASRSGAFMSIATSPRARCFTTLSGESYGLPAKASTNNGVPL
jgi:hypothetical protein